MSHTWISHGTHVNESWHTCEWVMSHIWMSHVTHLNESQHTWMRYATYTNRSGQNMCLWLSHVTHSNESCHVTHMNVSVSHIWMGQVEMFVCCHNPWLYFLNESCHTHESVLSHMWRRRVTLLNVSCPTCKYFCDTVNESCHAHEWVMSHTQVISSIFNSTWPPRANKPSNAM